MSVYLIDRNASSYLHDGVGRPIGLELDLLPLRPVVVAATAGEEGSGGVDGPGEAGAEPHGQQHGRGHEHQRQVLPCVRHGGQIGNGREGRISCGPTRTQMPIAEDGGTGDRPAAADGRAPLFASFLLLVPTPQPSPLDTMVRSVVGVWIEWFGL